MVTFTGSRGRVDGRVSEMALQGRAGYIILWGLVQHENAEPVIGKVYEFQDGGSRALS